MVLYIRFEDGSTRTIKDVWRHTVYTRQDVMHAPEMVIYTGAIHAAEYLELTRIVSITSSDT